MRMVRMIPLIFIMVLMACESSIVVESEAEIITTTIVGSAEEPDPVLEEVQRLQEKGVIRDVEIMESYPVQIKLTGPRDVIEKLEVMPRIKM